MTIHSPARRWFDLWGLAVSRPRPSVAFSRRHLLVLAMIVYPILLALLYLSEVGHITAIRQETQALRAQHTRLVQENAYLIGRLGERLNVERVAQAADALNSTVAVIPMGEMGVAVREQPLTVAPVREEHSEGVHAWWQVFHLESLSTLVKR